MKTGIEIIADERKRQVEKENWTPEHDNAHWDQALPLAAAAYAVPSSFYIVDQHGRESMWPWDDEYWKPTPNERIKELAKAGALIAAEIDRIQRLDN